MTTAAAPSGIVSQATVTDTRDAVPPLDCLHAPNGTTICSFGAAAAKYEDIRAELDVLIARAGALDVEMGRALAAQRVKRHGRYWAVYDPDGSLVCVTVYKRGALEVARRLEGAA